MVQGVKRNLTGETISVKEAVVKIKNSAIENFVGGYISNKTSSTIFKRISNSDTKGTTNIAKNYKEKNAVKTVAKEKTSYQSLIIDKAIGTIAGFFTKITAKRISAKWR